LSLQPIPPEKPEAMARFTFCAVLAATLGAATASPAIAQFGSIFGEPAPRPPSNVPSRPPLHGVEGGQDTGLLPPGPPPSQRGGIRGQPLPPPPGSVQVEPEPLPPPQQQQGALTPPVQQPLPPIQTQPGAAPLPAPTAVPAPGSPGLPPGQRQPRGTPQPANTAPQPGDEVVTEVPGTKVVNPTAVFAGLDKITGRIISFDVAIGETVQFGALQVTPRVCYSRPPTETQQTDGFVEVDEVTLQGEIKRIFTGWMFAASPGLHGVEHSIYDVWLTTCKGGATTVAATPPEAAPAQPQPQQPRQQRRQQAQQPQQQPGQPQQPRAQQQPQQPRPQPQFQTLQPQPAPQQPGFGR
jgi:hypothetical protein